MNVVLIKIFIVTYYNNCFLTTSGTLRVLISPTWRRGKILISGYEGET
jgi:hypothetical protein